MLSAIPRQTPGIDCPSGVALNPRYESTDGLLPQARGPRSRRVTTDRLPRRFRVGQTLPPCRRPPLCVPRASASPPRRARLRLVALLACSAPLAAQSRRPRVTVQARARFESPRTRSVGRRSLELRARLVDDVGTAAGRGSLSQLEPTRATRRIETCARRAPAKPGQAARSDDRRERRAVPGRRRAPPLGRDRPSPSGVTLCTCRRSTQLPLQARPGSSSSPSRRPRSSSTWTSPSSV